MNMIINIPTITTANEHDMMVLLCSYYVDVNYKKILLAVMKLTRAKLNV